MDLVEALTSLEQTLTLWCMSVNATSDDEVTHFNQWVELRERISSTVQQLELNRANWAARDLSRSVKDVNRLSAFIQDTDREVEHARDILDKVTGALDLAAKAAGVVGV
jgi:hypothetical protein